MKRFVALLVMCVVVAGLALTGAVNAQFPPPPPLPPPPPRHRVVVRPGWPIVRPLLPVIVRPPRVVIRVEPVRFLPPVVFGGVAVAVRRNQWHDNLVWEDSETIYRDQEWTEFTLNCNARGVKLWLEVRDGWVNIDWAEVVFDNGDTQVVDFNERSINRGLYSLLDFQDGRQVDHVRMVARAVGPKAKLILRMEK